MRNIEWILTLILLFFKFTVAPEMSWWLVLSPFIVSFIHGFTKGFIDGIKDKYKE